MRPLYPVGAPLLDTGRLVLQQPTMVLRGRRIIAGDLKRRNSDCEGCGQRGAEAPTGAVGVLLETLTVVPGHNAAPETEVTAPSCVPNVGPVSLQERGRARPHLLGNFRRLGSRAARSRPFVPRKLAGSQAKHSSQEDAAFHNFVRAFH